MTNPPGRVQGAYRQPFEEQIEFFKQKVRLPTARYDDLIGADHDKAFVVAGAMKAELLKDLSEATLAAIQDGETLSEFQKRFASITDKHGWTDYTGADTKAGRAWRTRTIYNTNLRTSHAAGRWAQMTDPDVLRDRPYWQYVHTTVDNPRLKHQKLDKNVWGATDTIWQIIYPPNGWGCACRVRTLSASQAERLGVVVEDSFDPGFDANLISDKTVPSEWRYAPGRTWQPDLDRYPNRVAKSLVAEAIAEGVFTRWIARIETQRADLAAEGKLEGLNAVQKNKVVRTEDTGEYFNVAVLSRAQQQMLGSKTATVRFSEYDALKQSVSRAGNKGFDTSSYLQVQRVLDDATLVIRSTDQGMVTAKTVWIQGVTKTKEPYLAVLQQTKAKDEIYLKSYRLLGRTKVAAEARRGEVLLDKRK